MFYDNKIKYVKNDKKRLWSLVNGMIGHRLRYLEMEGKFLTKPEQIANYFKDYFHDNVNNFRSNMHKTICTKRISVKSK